MTKSLVAAALAALILSGCDTGMGTKQTVGALGGAVGGGLLGSQFGSGSGQLIMTGVGTILGAWVGSEIGRSLDNADEAAAHAASQKAFETAPTGSTTTWRNPDSGNYGTITPTNTYQQNGSYCREYTQTIYVQGRAETARGTACRNGDGSWRVVS
jgi:surface antigen